MAELADAQDLGSCGVLRAGSSPVTRTIKDMQKRYIPEKPRFYRGFSRLKGVDFFVTKYGCKTTVFPFWQELNFRNTTE